VRASFALLIEKGLSVDNPIVLLIIMSTLAVPKEYQQKVFLFGIAVALVMRAFFIAIGAVAISLFSYMFVVSRLFLIWTGIQLARHKDEDPDISDNRVVQFARRRLPARGERERSARRHAAVPRVPGGREHGPALRARLDPRDLRDHAGPVPRLHGEGLRPARPAGAVLPAGQAAGTARLPPPRAGGHPGVHRRQAHPPFLHEDVDQAIPHVPTSLSLGSSSASSSSRRSRASCAAGATPSRRRTRAGCAATTTGRGCTTGGSWDSGGWSGRRPAFDISQVPILSVVAARMRVMSEQPEDHVEIILLAEAISAGQARTTAARERREAARGRAVEMRSAGASYHEIADELGLSRSTAYNWTRAVVDLPRTARRGRREEQIRAARSLRQQGRSYAQIAEQAGVSVATVYGWTFDVVVRGDDERDLGGRTRAERRETSRRAWEPRQREAERSRQQTKLSAANEIRPASKRDLFVAGLTAYWAEGAKDKHYRRQERLVFTNSDPFMIRLFADWLDLLGVAPERRRYRVSIHETADVGAAERHWCSLLGLPAGAMQSATIKRHNPATNRLRTGEDYHGCLVISVLQSAELYQQVEGRWYGLASPGRQRPGAPEPPRGR
jgi:transposase